MMYLKRGMMASLLAAAMSLSGWAHAAQVVMGAPAVNSDGSVSVQVNLAPGQNDSVGALQFDLHFDANQFSVAQVEAGLASSNAGKDIVFSEPEPGVVRVLMAGVNTATVGQGAVATVHFDALGKDATTPSFADNATLQQVVVSDLLGRNTQAEVSYTQPPSGTNGAGSNTGGTSSQTAGSNTASTAGGGFAGGAGPSFWDKLLFPDAGKDASQQTSVAADSGKTASHDAAGAGDTMVLASGNSMSGDAPLVPFDGEPGSARRDRSPRASHTKSVAVASGNKLASRTAAGSSLENNGAVQDGIVSGLVSYLLPGGARSGSVSVMLALFLGTTIVLSLLALTGRTFKRSREKR